MSGLLGVNINAHGSRLVSADVLPIELPTQDKNKNNPVLADLVNKNGASLSELYRDASKHNDLDPNRKYEGDEPKVHVESFRQTVGYVYGQAKTVKIEDVLDSENLDVQSSKILPSDAAVKTDKPAISPFKLGAGNLPGFPRTVQG